MENTEARLCCACWLHSIPGIGNKTARKLTEYAGGEEAVYRLPLKDAEALLTPAQAEGFRKWRKEKEPERLLKEVLKKGIVFAPWFSEDYPKRLLTIPDAPYAVYMLGKKVPEKMRLVALIGARRCSGYGEKMAGEIGRELAERGVGVVSGLARGIDGIGQWSALSAGGYSVGVPGCGVDVCYPRENRGLYEKCAKQGLLLSEYAPGTEPAAWNFPARNRLISGLSDAVIVVEAREKSGTLITVDMALEQGREVFAVPGRLTDPYSAGCNGLIGQGAQLFTSVDDMLLGIAPSLESVEDRQPERENRQPERENRQPERENRQPERENGQPERENPVGRQERETFTAEIDSLTEKVYTLCDYYSKSVTELFKELKQEDGYRDVTMAQLMETLLELMVSGRIFEKGQNYYYRRN